MILSAVIIFVCFFIMSTILTFKVPSPSQCESTAEFHELMRFGVARYTCIMTLTMGFAQLWSVMLTSGLSSIVPTAFMAAYLVPYLRWKLVVANELNTLYDEEQVIKKLSREY